MSLADEAERLLTEYTNAIDYSFDSRDRRRTLKCSFCTRSYKYQAILNEHVNSQEHFHIFSLYLYPARSPRATTRADHPAPTNPSDHPISRGPSRATTLVIGSSAIGSSENLLK